MPVLRVSRDKRGYEHVYLIDVPGGADRPRLLYWFRTPPGVKVGRDALDAATRRALEAGNPDVAFDWRTLAVTPPAPEPPNWRERRLASRAARRAAAEGDQDSSTPSGHDTRAGGGRSRKRRRTRSEGSPPVPVESPAEPQDLSDSTDTPSEAS